MIGIAIGIFFGLLPDIDSLLLLAKLKNFTEAGVEFKHHSYPTHFPIIYAPLVVIVIIIPNIYTLTMITALYLHLFADTFYTSDGIKWLYPFKNDFYSLLSAKTLGKHGIFWEFEYAKSPCYTLEFILLIGGCFVLWLNHIIFYHTPLWSIILLGSFIIVFLIGGLFIERKRKQYLKKKTDEIREKRIE